MNNLKIYTYFEIKNIPQLILVKLIKFKNLNYFF